MGWIPCKISQNVSSKNPSKYFEHFSRTKFKGIFKYSNHEFKNFSPAARFISYVLSNRYNGQKSYLKYSKATVVGSVRSH